MEHLILFFYIFSVMAGVAAVSIAMFIYFALYKKKSILFFSAFITSLMLIVVELALIKYRGIIGTEDRFLAVVADILDIISVTLLLYSMPLFFGKIMGVEYNKYLKKFFIGYIPTILLLITAYKISNNEVLRDIGQIVMFGEILFTGIVVMINVKKIGDENIKMAMRVMGVIFLLFFPVLIFESVRDKIEFFKNMNFLEIFSLPLMFLIINSLSILFAVKQFNRPFYVENNKLTDYFCNKFQITEREREIIELVVKGHTYKMIAEELCIAYKTVDNHVQNIYQKTKINSKIQLINLVQSDKV